MELYDVIHGFIKRWFTTFIISFVVGAVVFMRLSPISAYAIIVVVILCEILKQVRRVAVALEFKNVQS